MEKTKVLLQSITREKTIVLIDKNKNNFSWVEGWGRRRGGNGKKDAYAK